MEATKYKEAKVFEFPNMIARVYSPELTEEERKRRYKLIYDAAESLLKSSYRRALEA